MTTSIQISAKGPGPTDRWQLTLSESQTVRLGRATAGGASIPWDRLISREHADVCWRDGKLHALCLPAARNPLLYLGKQTRELWALPGERFQIGKTTFELREVKSGEGPEKSHGADYSDDVAHEEQAYSAQQLREVSFGNTERQMEILSELPNLISTSQTDEELGEFLARLLLSAIPRAEAVAVAHFDPAQFAGGETTLDRFPKPKSQRVAVRDGYTGRFRPSRRLLFSTLSRQESSVYIWESTSSEKFTVSDELGWAFCCPIRGDSCRGWCLYVAGRGSAQGSLVLSQKDLLGDLRFTELVAQFIGSVRQVRLLQDQQTQLSTFFSPKVMENLTRQESRSTLVPAERDITVLFCDLRGFSQKSERLQGDLLSLLNSVSEALGVMVNGILECDGTIADFQGDAALGFWGWPVEFGDGPVQACVAALAIHDEFRRAAAQVGGPLEDFSVGIGIAHGRALAGRIGTDRQAKVGVFGPVVNQGSRLEGMTKQFGVSICIDEATAGYVKKYLQADDYRCRRLARVRPAGMNTPLMVFSVLPPESEYPETSNQTITEYERALDAVLAGNWAEAQALLGRLPAHDGPTQFLLGKLAGGNEPPSGWDGAFSLKSK